MKPGYKRTDVGIVPEDWEIYPLGKIFGLVNGYPFKPEHWKSTGTPIIRIQNLNDPTASFNYSKLAVPERNRVVAGDLLFAWSGTIGSSFGARVWTGPEGVLNQHIFKVLVDERQVTLPFARLVFAKVADAIAKQAHGFKTSFVHVRKSDLVNVQLPVPPRREQRAISEALSDMDALLSGLDRLIAKKRDLKQATMQQLLTGQIRLPGFNDEWRHTLLGSLLDRLSNGAQYTPSNRDGVLITRIETIASGIVDYTRTGCATWNTNLNQFALAKDDILFSHINSIDHIGKVAIVPADQPPLFHGMNLLLMRASQACNPKYLFFYLSAGITRQRMRIIAKQAVSQASISTAELRSLALYIPDRDEQDAIATVLSDMDAEITALESRREKTRALKQAMMQELLTGRTRLV